MLHPTASRQYSARRREIWAGIYQTYLVDWGKVRAILNSEALVDSVMVCDRLIVQVVEGYRLLVTICYLRRLSG